MWATPDLGSRAPTPIYIPLPIDWAALSPPPPFLDSESDDGAETVRETDAHPVTISIVPLECTF